MAVVRRSSSEAWTAGRIDIDKLDATTEAEIEAYMIVEGENPDAPFEGYEAVRVAQDAERNAKNTQSIMETEPANDRKIA